MDSPEIIGSNEIGLKFLSSTGEELLRKYVFENMVFL